MQRLTPERVHIAAFSEGATGGNPAGVWIGETLPPADEMQRIAAEVGFSETAFVAPLPGSSENTWRVRYFSPEAEVPFCGHATIAATAALAKRFGEGEYFLQLNQSRITVSGSRQPSGGWQATLLSPPTASAPVDTPTLQQALALFGYTEDDLDPALPPARIHGGADHLILALKTRQALAEMTYSQPAGRALMQQQGWVTILLVYAETAQKFHSRNPFAFGGVYEDPATGAASAALGGYLRDTGWPYQGHIDIIQGEDMGMRSLIAVEIDTIPGNPIRISGQAREMA